MAKKIGIDLDKTIFSCNSIIYRWLNNFNLNKGKILKHHVITDEKIYKCTFINKIFKFLNPDKYIFYSRAVKTINELSKNGYEIYLVSNRPCIKPVVAMTIDTLKRSGISFHKLILGCNNKIEFIKLARLDYFIDDVEMTCLNVLKETNAKPILFQPKLKDDRHRKLKRSGLINFQSWRRIKDFFVGEKKEERLECDKSDNQIKSFY